jgi:hypothetical protein
MAVVNILVAHLCAAYFGVQRAANSGMTFIIT